jgi:NPR1 interacting
MQFEMNERSKRKSLPVSPFSRTQLQAPQLTQTAPAWGEETRPQERDEEELEENMDKFYTLLGRIKTMKKLWRHGTESKRMKPVLEPVWQPTFSLEDFVGVGGEVRGGRVEEGTEEQQIRGMMEIPANGRDKREEKESRKEHPNGSEEMTWHEKEDNNDLDLDLSL